MEPKDSESIGPIANPQNEYDRDGGRAQESDAAQNPTDAFLALWDSLDEATQDSNICTRIDQEVGETGDYTKALKELKAFISKRKTPKVERRIHIANSEKDVTAERAERVIDRIREKLNKKTHFLGKGATASVFTLREDPNDRLRMMCAKVVSDSQQYENGVPVEEEMRFLDKLHDLQVEGVRTPRPTFAFKDGGLLGLAMEHLDAVGFERVMNGEETEGVTDVLPASFNSDDYFRSLRIFFEAMHARGIYHNDVDLRNFMIDRATGKPRLIDFGRANYRHQLVDAGRDPEKESKMEIEAIDAAERRVRVWMEKRSVSTP